MTVNDYLLTHEDVVTLVENLAEMDGRVTVSNLALSVWAEALQGRVAADVQTAVRQWFADDRNGPPTAAGIKKLTIGAATSREARARALAPGRGSDGRMTLAEWRAAHPGEWEALVEQGRAEQRQQAERFEGERAARTAPADDPFATFGQGWVA